MSVSIKRVVKSGEAYNVLTYKSYKSFTEDSIFNELNLRYNTEGNIIALYADEVIGEFNVTTKKGYISYAESVFGVPFL
jgi:hypothetical protein